MSDLTLGTAVVGTTLAGRVTKVHRRKDVERSVLNGGVVLYGTWCHSQSRLVNQVVDLADWSEEDRCRKCWPPEEGR